MGINWAILGTGVVANEMAVALSSAGKEIYAVGNRTHSKALDFAKKYDMNNRFFNRNLAGGAMLDIGVYALSFVRWFMDSKPNEIISQVKYAPTGVDEQATILLKNESEQMATVALTLHSKQPKRGMIRHTLKLWNIQEQQQLLLHILKMEVQKLFQLGILKKLLNMKWKMLKRQLMVIIVECSLNIQRMLWI